MIHRSDKASKVSETTVQQRQKLASNPWKISENDFPFDGTPSEQLKFLINYAVLAPSSHNTQPWSFNIVDDLVELHLDRSRALNIADPDCRELIISCGSALFNLRIAIRHFGYRDVVEVLPERRNPNLLARIGLGSKRVVKLEENFLFRAIPKRCTNRFPFDNCELPTSLISELECATDAECTGLQVSASVIPHTMRREVIELIDEGDRIQMADPLFRRELASWLNSQKSSRDGMPPHASGMDRRLDAIAPVISFIVRSFDMGKFQSAKDCQLATQAPVLMVIGSQDDNDFGWLATGEALAHLLLRARIDDVAASFFNQPIQVPRLRSRLQNLFPNLGHPQILLRLGYAKDIESTPRRTIGEVLN